MESSVGKPVAAVRRTSQKDRVARAIRRDISERRYPHNAPLPSYFDLAKQHGVSRTTIIGAMDVLEEEGLICRAERRGTFVRRPFQSRPDETRSSRPYCVNIITQNTGMGDVQAGSEYLVGYSDALDHHDMRMCFSILSGESENFEMLFSPKAYVREQACVLISVINPAFLRWLHESGVPFVVQAYTHCVPEGFPEHHGVYINKYGGAFEATNHLLALGHRRVGWIGRTESEEGFPRASYDGWRAALNIAGVASVSSDVLRTEPADRASFESNVAAYLRREQRPSAVMAFDDATAIGVLRVARTLGIRVPQELSIVGFNNEPETEKTDPLLTTVSSPRRVLARTAVEMLLAAAAGEYDSFQRRVLDCHLVVRESTAAPGGWRGETGDGRGERGEGRTEN